MMSHEEAMEVSALMAKHAKLEVEHERLLEAMDYMLEMHPDDRVVVERIRNVGEVMKNNADMRMARHYNDDECTHLRAENEQMKRMLAEPPDIVLERDKLRAENELLTDAVLTLMGETEHGKRMTIEQRNFVGFSALQGSKWWKMQDMPKGPSLV